MTGYCYDAGMAKRTLGTHFLKQWREYRGVSLRKLAGLMESEPGVELTSHANIGRIENMQQPYSQEIMEAVAETLGCSVIDLLTVDPTVDGFSEGSPDAKLRSSLIAYGVDGTEVEQVVDIVKTFAPDAKSEESPSREQSLPATPRREPARTR